MQATLDSPVKRLDPVGGRGSSGVAGWLKNTATGRGRRSTPQPVPHHFAGVRQQPRPPPRRRPGLECGGRAFLGLEG